MQRWQVLFQKWEKTESNQSTMSQNNHHTSQWKGSWTPNKEVELLYKLDQEPEELKEELDHQEQVPPKSWTHEEPCPFSTNSQGS